MLDVTNTHLNNRAITFDWINDAITSIVIQIT